MSECSNSIDLEVASSPVAPYAWKRCRSEHKPRHEEIVNAITHGTGLALAVPAAIALMFVAIGNGNPWAIAACGVYSISLLLVYSASAFSHALTSRRSKEFFTILDPAVIFLLVAGTYTPFAVQYLHDPQWWLLTGTIWAVALTGFVRKLTHPNGTDWAAVSIYVLLGWLPAIALKPLVSVMPTACMALIVAGGVIYTLGTVFLLLDTKIKYFHAVWHTFVIVAGACHYVGIFVYVASQPA